MDFLLLTYVLISIVMISGSFFINYVAGKTTQAALLGIGFFVAAIVFGIRWFPGGSLVTTTYSGSWPPSINTCPDFLTLTKVNGKSYCVDPVGVSRRDNGGMNKWTGPDQTDPSYLFDLHTDLRGAERLNALYAECKARGVTWEGVYNGSVGLGKEPPLP